MQFHLADQLLAPLDFLSVNENSPAKPSLAIVLDLGSAFLRAGWDSSASATISLLNVIHKGVPRIVGYPSILVGGSQADAMNNFTRFTTKSSCDGGLLSMPEVFQIQLDFIFSQLAVKEEGEQISLLITEPIGNLEVCKQSIIRAIQSSRWRGVCKRVGFVPSVVCHGDLQNEALVVEVGNRSTTVAAIVAGSVAMARRIAVGSSLIAEHFLGLIRCKYPSFFRRITFEESCSLVFKLADYEDFGSDHCLYFNLGPGSVAEPEIVEKKSNDAADRLRELASAKRSERFAEAEKIHLQLVSLIKQGWGSDRWPEERTSLGFASDSDFARQLRKARDQLNQVRRQSGIVEPLLVEDKVLEVEQEILLNEEQLLETADDQLTLEELKEKRKLRIIRAGQEARDRIKRSKEKIEADQKRELEEDDQLRVSDFDAWLERTHAKRSSLLRSVAADSSHEKIKKMSNLLQNKTTGADSAKGKKKKKPLKEENDNFGEDESDWLQYDDSSAIDEGTLDEISRIEELLIRYDPNFIPGAIDTPEQAIEHSEFLRWHFYALPATERRVLPEHKSRLVIGREIRRAADLLFQPHFAGIDHCGLAELILFVGKNFSAQIYERVFVGGFGASIRGLQSRLERELRPNLPESQSISISCNGDPLGTWAGARRLLRSDSKLITWVNI